MAHFQNQSGAAAQTDAYGNVLSTDAYGNVARTDEYGNVISTDEYGNPIRHSGTPLQGVQQQQRHDLSGKLHRSGSSSSSEDDGQGGRRKKGLKEKIKEKIPGIGQKDHRSDTSSATATTTYTTTGYGTGEQQQQQQQHHAEKKGVMEKIKEKLAGNRTSQDQHHQHY
ncbi:hypothetical protein I3760_08G137000 [Carya illinoinensis]|nr:hypothetical protein I3760_08G137000 [Carya illinoinensis]